MTEPTEGLVTSLMLKEWTFTTKSNDFGRMKAVKKLWPLRDNSESYSILEDFLQHAPFQRNHMCHGDPRYVMSHEKTWLTIRDLSAEHSAWIWMWTAGFKLVLIWAAVLDCSFFFLFFRQKCGFCYLFLCDFHLSRAQTWCDVAALSFVHHLA